MSEPDAAERRRNPRAEHLAITSVLVLARHNAGITFSIESLSTSGARLIGPLTLDVGEAVELLFELDGRPLDVHGEVVRVEHQDLMTDRVAVAFRNLGDSERDSIRRLVSAAVDVECALIESEQDSR